jgi:hypothetical protein
VKENTIKAASTRWWSALIIAPQSRNQIVLVVVLVLE